MFGMLVAYDDAGNVIATLESLVTVTDDGQPTLVDFTAHEANGRDAVELWIVDGAKGSKVWPEYLGGKAHEYRVELAGEPGRKRIARLVHRVTGEARERVPIDDRIRRRILEAEGGPVDLRNIIGGPEPRAPVRRPDDR
jgi:hypothetical protein